MPKKRVNTNLYFSLLSSNFQLTTFVLLNFVMLKRLPKSYFQSADSLYLAQDLLGKHLVRDFGNGEMLCVPIVETEAYLGTEDLASHASKGRTPRTEIMFLEGGYVYAYLIYGVHWLLNIVTGPAEHAQAVLIRGVEGISGPGRVGKAIGLDRSFYGEDLGNSARIWIEDHHLVGEIVASPRIGVDYAGEVWKNKLWRFELK